MSNQLDITEKNYQLQRFSWIRPEFTPLRRLCSTKAGNPGESASRTVVTVAPITG